MRASAGTAFLAAAILAICPVRTRGATLLDRTNAWKPGEPVPAELLHYQPPAGTCFVAMPENFAALCDTTNDALLMEMLLAPCDQAMFDCAADTAFVRLGAGEFLTRLRKRYSAHPSLLAEKRQSRLYALTRRRHVTVDCLYVEDTDMPAAERDATLARITAELRVVAPFAAVLKKHSGAYRYDEISTLSDGTKTTLRPTHIGNNGDFVLTANNLHAINRSAEVPAEHAWPLLAAKPGDVLILRNEAKRRLDLYHIREVYDPPAP